MRLSIRHETHYEYETPVDYSVQRLYLWPLDHVGQTTVSWTISCPGIDTALNYVDGFGNRVHLVTFRDAEGPVSIVAEGLVDRTDTAGVAKGLSMAAPGAVFLRQTKATLPNGPMRTMSDRIATAEPEPLARLHRLMSEVHERVAYEIGTTHAHTTAAEAFSDGKGVCQDHAHIFIGAARSLDIPVRYVTGYLVTGEGASSTAAHAWAEALVPSLGWVGFDAANNTCPTDHYVRIAAGIDAASVAPVRGSRRGGAAERMTVEVRVEIAQQ
ncbi:MAG: transglutaminase family protein [Alphaproteobacteria bacterium]|nr:transglutaminase family protein [Alphaproteobacteria bacterium]